MKNFINSNNLHKRLNIKTRRDIWIRRKLKKIKAIEGVDYFIVKEKVKKYFISPKTKEKILNLYNQSDMPKTYTSKPKDNHIKKFDLSFDYLGFFDEIENNKNIEDLKKENSKLKKLLDSFTIFHSTFLKSIKRLDNLQMRDNLKTISLNPKKAKKDLNPILVLTDLHIGKIVNSDDMFGFNEFNSSIAKERISVATDKFINFYKRFDDEIETINVLLLGDLIENDLNHQNELEFSIPLQIEKASEIILGAIQSIQNAFKDKEIRVFGVVGNHGRFVSMSKGKKMPTYDILNSSYEFLIFKFLELQGVNIFFNSANEQLVKIGDLNLLLTHGDNMKINTHSPNSIINQIEKKTKLFQEIKNNYFDLLVMGHLHSPFNYNNKIIIGASVVGYDDFAKSLNIKPSKPSITSFAIKGKEIIFYKNINVN